MKNIVNRHIYGIFVLSVPIFSAGCFENPAEFRRALTGEESPSEKVQKNIEFCTILAFGYREKEILFDDPRFDYYFCCSIMDGGCK
jgi:hypothetical protein